MLIFLIVVGVFLIGLVLMISCKFEVFYDKGKRKLVWSSWSFDDYTRGIVGFILLIIGSLALLVSGTLIICSRSKLSKEEHKVQYEMEIDKLLDKQEAIYLALTGELNLKINDEGTTYHVLIDKPTEMLNVINEYNSEVKELKKKIYLEKVCEENIWINWFVNPAYKNLDNYNAQAKRYNEILGDALKTFELSRV